MWLLLNLAKSPGVVRFDSRRCLGGWGLLSSAEKCWHFALC